MRGAKRKRGASKAILAVAKQSTVSPEQRQITAFFGGAKQVLVPQSKPGLSQSAVVAAQKAAAPIDLEPEAKTADAIDDLPHIENQLADGYGSVFSQQYWCLFMLNFRAPGNHSHSEERRVSSMLRMSCIGC